MLYPVAGTPCETAIDEGRQVLVPDRVVELYPLDPDLRPHDAVSYIGVPLLDLDGHAIGQLAALDDKPMYGDARCLSAFQIFAARAAAELRRIKAEERIREREVQLSRLLDGARDAIVSLDDRLRIELLNTAAREVFGAGAGDLPGVEFASLLDDGSAARLRAVASRVSAPEASTPSSWIGGGLTVTRRDRGWFQAEATLSHYRDHGQSRFTLILRDVNARLEAEARIRDLEQRTEVLREELDRFHGFHEIVGESPALLRALEDMAQVAAMDTTVLLLGETGTGKELFARAVHAASPRRDRPMVTVNCAAIPADLMESELFGHEKGAFTGATSRRDGRFTVAHQGTLFLDELGELPLPLQAKLLRVLQEGEVQPVGSSHLQKVDVRIVAATNRDLAAAVQRGEFREDLYYRLSVFPIRIPPLRERGDDIVLLAERFAKNFQRRVGRTLAPLTAACKERLRTYSWPGNVRELQNVIERGVITATAGCLNLDRALPEPPPVPGAPVEQKVADVGEVMTALELKELERRNILRALERTDWRVSGPGGAAALLGMNPSTLASRMRALKVERPR
jgi:PAS domain S-box-containing protein